MPELPEVETIGRDLNEFAAGRVIEAVAVRYGKVVASGLEEFGPLLTGATVKSAGRLGKWVRINLADGAIGTGGVLLAHLKMTGQFVTGAWPKTEADWPPHCHVALKLSGLPPENDTLFYRDIRKFGRLRAFNAKAFEIFAAELAQGPDALDITGKALHKILSAKSGRLKGVLLDQSVIAGLGNIYADESLFAAKLSPLKSAGTVTAEESERLAREIRRILKAAVKARGSSVSNYQGLKGAGAFQNSHKVYGRAGSPCPECLRPLEKITVAGRSSVYCPHCQKSK